MRYDESNLNKRLAHFELLNKLAENGKLSEEDSIKYINLLVKQNPYTYKTSPVLEVRKPDKNEKKIGIRGLFDNKTKKLIFMIPKENITWQNLRESVGIVGHEMKHYFQHKNVMDYLYSNQKYNSQTEYKEYIFKNLESKKTHSRYSAESFVKGINEIPLKSAFGNSLLKLKISKRFFSSLSFASYYTFFHEYDARKAQENFAYGMMKSYANDPLIENYPKVKKLFSNYLDKNSQKADEYHKSCLDNLEHTYRQQLHKLLPLRNSLTKLALNGKLKNQKSVNTLTAHLLSLYYDKDTNIKIIENNINSNSDLSNIVNHLSLLNCPRKDLSEFQELYVKNVLNNNYKTLLNVMLTNEQNQQIVDKIITQDKDLKTLSKLTSDRYFNSILTDDYKTKMVDEIIDTFKDENIDYQDLFSISMGLVPKLDKQDAQKLDDFYKTKYQELEKRENGNAENDFVVEYERTLQ